MNIYKNKNGITLIALIITIIIMLILAGVTINVSLNGGLFEKTQNASIQTQIEIDKEELQITILGSYNQITGEINPSDLKRNLESNGWIVNITGLPYICTSSKGNSFNVDAYGNITTVQSTSNKESGGQQTSEVPDILRQYLLGINYEGRPLFTEIDEDNGILSISQQSFIGKSPISNANSVLHFIQPDYINSYIYFKYDTDGKYYRISFDSNYISQDNIKVAFDPNSQGSNYGRTLTYNGKSYTVIQDNGTELELIANYLSNTPVSLGSDTYEDGLAIYNNVIAILNNACITASGLSVDGTHVKSIRSIGNSGLDDNSGLFANPNPTKFTAYEGNAKAIDYYFILDYIKMLDSNTFNMSDDYYLASRNINGISGNSASIDFYINTYYSYSQHLDMAQLAEVRSNGETNAQIQHKYVRPVVTLSSTAPGILWD